MIKVAIVGCGTMGNVHAKGYANIKNAKVTAVCDIRKEKGMAISELLDAKYYESYDEMLKEDVDIVDICLPTYMHKEFALKAMELGKHVFCEKPIALSVKDAEEMVNKAKEMNVKLSVGHVVRFFPAYKNAVKLVEQGKIGTPKLIRTTRNGGYPGWSWENWYSNYELSGGPLLDLVIHDIDWIISSFGDVQRVYAKSFNGKVERKDHCLVTLTLKNGSIAHVEGSWAYPDGAIFGTTFEVIGTTGQIESDSRSSSPIKKYTNNGAFNMALDSPLQYKDEPYTAELQEFINAVIEEREPLITGEAAIKAIKVSLAAIKSSKTGEAVEL